MNTVQVPGSEKKAAIFGVILGVVSFLMTIATLLISASAIGLMTLSFITVVLVYVVSLAVACVFAVRLRRLHGGYWDFRTALKHIFIMLAISAVLSAVASRTVTAINPSMEERAIDNTMNKSIEYLESMGLPDEQIDATVEQLEKQKEDLYTFSISGLIQTLAISLIMYFILSLILAAIFKKERPVFVQDVNSGSAHPWQQADDAQQPKG